jgi:hypothetical protein
VGGEDSNPFNYTSPPHILKGLHIKDLTAI